MSYVAGIDLGGTKIEGIIARENAVNQPLCRLRIPTEREKGYQHIVSQIGKLCELMSRETGLPFPEKVGIGTPGAIDPVLRTIKNSNTQCLNNQPLHEDVNRLIGRNCVLANDANCFALAEATLGSARGYETVFGVIMGTGVGGGLVVHGRVLNGCHGIAGEWGQLILDANSELVSPYGKLHGTAEAILSGPGLERFYELRSGKRCDLREVVRLAEAGEDPAAQATMQHLVRYFAMGMSVLINIFDPHAIILGGGVGNIAELYGETARQEIIKHVFNPRLDTVFLKPALGDSAGVFGAAMLVCESIQQA